MNRLTRAIAAASARRPWRTVASWVLLVGAVLALAGSVGGAFVDDFAAPGSQSARAMSLLEKRFPQAADGKALVVFAVKDGATLQTNRGAVETTLARIREADHVAAVADPFTAGTISADGRVGFAELTLDRPAVELGKEPFRNLAKVVASSNDSGVHVELGGDAVFLNADQKTSGAEAVGILAALVVLLVAFGSVVAALVPIGLALVAVGVGLGGITLLAGSLDMSASAPAVAAMVGLGVGIDYALFIVARYRENRSAGQDNQRALSDAMGSSGAAVVFAGGTVVVAMVALALTGISVLTSIGLATALVVLMAVAAAITLLPAMLGLLGDRIDKGTLLGRRRTATRPEDGTWWRFAHQVAARPWPYLLGATVALLAVATPALWMQTGFPDAGDDPTTTTHRRAYDLLAEGFGPGFNGPLLIVVDQGRHGSHGTDVRALTARITADPHISSVGEPQTSVDGDTVVFTAIPTTGPANPETSRTIAGIRAVIPSNVYVSGITAMTDDLNHQLSRTLPIFVGAVLAALFLLLMLVFRSIVVPLKAALMNLLSIGGAYGVLVAVFQWGWLSSLIGLEGPVPITSLIPVIMFPILFGLSMDYEMFLLSRIREEYARTRDNTESVARGLASTGRVITSAALIMVAVFLSFVASPVPSLKMLGLGLATAILIDATIVRMILVPAAMALMGRANWWLPGWLDRALPHLIVDGRPDPTQQTDGAAHPGLTDPIGSTGTADQLART